MPAGAGLGLTGTLPLSGPTLAPSRKGASTVATFADGRPAILLDKADHGRIMVLPFSLTQSALNSGISTVYSRLIREAVLATMPQPGESDDIASVTLTVSSSTGPVQTRLTENLPAGSTVLWSSARSAGKQPGTFELTAESEPKTIQYFFRPGSTGDRRSSTAVASACGGNFVIQGKVE